MLRLMNPILRWLSERPERAVLACGTIFALAVVLMPTWRWSVPTPWYMASVPHATEGIQRAWIWASPHVGARFESEQMYLPLWYDAVVVGSLLVWMRARRNNRQIAQEWRSLWENTQEAQRSSLLRASQQTELLHATLVRPASAGNVSDTTTLLRVPTQETAALSHRDADRYTAPANQPDLTAICAVRTESGAHH